ncbi:EamA family transporter [Methylobacterium soli]|uniref:EamA family transporter n=1 Tax=Methylobacterium soli TaxID=553447 RepID=UPI001EE35CEC|nr:EamA family transporter [Methylobacterium soli]
MLTFTALIWAGDAVAGKWAVGQVLPLAPTSLRWLIACVALAPLAAQPAAREWRLLPSWRYILLMGSHAAFNALFYVAGTYTSATNLALIQGEIPVIVIVWSAASLPTTRLSG